MQLPLTSTSIVTAVPPDAQAAGEISNRQRQVLKPSRPKTQVSHYEQFRLLDVHSHKNGVSMPEKAILYLKKGSQASLRFARPEGPMGSWVLLYRKWSNSFHDIEK